MTRAVRDLALPSAQHGMEPAVSEQASNPLRTQGAACPFEPELATTLVNGSLISGLSERVHRCS